MKKTLYFKNTDTGIDINELSSHDIFAMTTIEYHGKPFYDLLQQKSECYLDNDILVTFLKDYYTKPQPIATPNIVTPKGFSFRKHELDEDQYLHTIGTKKQIYLHHTASDASPFNVINYWNNNKERVATPIVIANTPLKDSYKKKFKDGDVFLCYDLDKWAYHLGTDTKPPYIFSYRQNTALSKSSIGIELCSWGWVYEDAYGYFRNWMHNRVGNENVITYEQAFRGKHHYFKYSDAQLKSLRNVLLYLCEKYNIDKRIKGNIFDINQYALDGESGIYTHASVRTDKSDCHPQPSLKRMLNSLA